MVEARVGNQKLAEALSPHILPRGKRVVWAGAGRVGLAAAKDSTEVRALSSTSHVTPGNSWNLLFWKSRIVTPTWFTLQGFLGGKEERVL